MFFVAIKKKVKEADWKITRILTVAILGGINDFNFFLHFYSKAVM